MRAYFKMTDKEQAFVLENAATMPAIEIAAKLGRDVSGLRKWIKARGIVSPKMRLGKLLPEHDQYVVDNWQQQSDGQMANFIGVSTETVRKMRIRLRLCRVAYSDRQKKDSPRAARTFGYLQVRKVEAPKDSLDNAAEFLSCHDRTPVFRIDDKGQPSPKGKLWRYGTTRLTTDEMMAKAARKGFDPDAWRRLAA